MAAARTHTTILLVRHGQTQTTGTILPGRAPGLHLSERGVAQADGVAARIAELSRRPVALYVSPLERARETASPIAKALKLRPVVERGLIETRPGDDDPGAVALLHKLAQVSRKRWPETANPGPRRLPLTAHPSSSPSGH